MQYFHRLKTENLAQAISFGSVGRYLEQCTSSTAVTSRK
jgi:hypothetical protein